MGSAVPSLSPPSGQGPHPGRRKGCWGGGHGSRVEDQQEGAGQQHVQQPQGLLQPGLLAFHIVPHLGAHVLPARVEAQHPGLLLFLVEGRCAGSACCSLARPTPSLLVISLPCHPTHVPRILPGSSGVVPSAHYPPGHSIASLHIYQLTPSHTWLTIPSPSQVHAYLAWLCPLPHNTNTIPLLVPLPHPQPPLSCALSLVLPHALFPNAFLPLPICLHPAPLSLTLRSILAENSPSRP